MDAPGQRHGQQPVSGTVHPGVVKQDKSSRGSVDTTKIRLSPQRVRMSSGERPIGAAKGKQSDTKALCQPPHRVPCGPVAIRPCGVPRWLLVESTPGNSHSTLHSTAVSPVLRLWQWWPPNALGSKEAASTAKQPPHPKAASSKPHL